MRAYDPDFQVAGKPLLLPDAGVQLTLTDLDAEEAGRDEAGVMHRAVVRERVRTFGFTYAFLTAQEYHYLLSLFTGRPTFTFSWRDETGVTRSCTAYCSNSSVSFYNRKLGLYRDLQFNIIEC